MKQWIIKYYVAESSYRAGVAAFTETISGDRNYVTNWAMNKVRNSQFKYFDIMEK